jgi:archaellum component FlaC
MVKKPLQSLVSNVANDLARFQSKPQEAISGTLILQSVLKNGIRKWCADTSGRG